MPVRRPEAVLRGRQIRQLLLVAACLWHFTSFPKLGRRRKRRSWEQPAAAARLEGWEDLADKEVPIAAGLTRELSRGKSGRRERRRTRPQISGE